MKPITPGCAPVIVSLILLGLPRLPEGSAPVPGAVATDTSFVLASTDSGYADAMSFARLLERQGFHIALVARSMSAGFLGEPRAASYKTDRGNFAVVFFPPPDGAERVPITSEVRGGHYCYTYRTQQPGLGHEQKEDMDGPQRFVVRRRWFIFVWDGVTEWALKRALAAP